MDNQLHQFLRDTFYTLMKEVQKSGITLNEHVKKPYLYTGSWMEGVLSVNDLLERVKAIENPCEAMMRAFNLLCPYSEKLTLQNESLKTISQFY